MGLIGETHTEVIDVVRQKVKYPHSANGVWEYDAPRGLAILSYKAVERANYGRNGYTWLLVGDKSVFVNDVFVDSNFRRVFDYIDSSVEDSKKGEYKKRVEELKEEAQRLSRVTASTNSKLACTWSVRHDGNVDRKGGSLELAVEIKFIAGLGTYNIDSTISTIITAIRSGFEPQAWALYD